MRQYGYVPAVFIVFASLNCARKEGNQKEAFTKASPTAIVETPPGPSVPSHDGSIVMSPRLKAMFAPTPEEAELKKRVQMALREERHARWSKLMEIDRRGDFAKRGQLLLEFGHWHCILNGERVWLFSGNFGHNSATGFLEWEVTSGIKLIDRLPPSKAILGDLKDNTRYQRADLVSQEKILRVVPLTDPTDPSSKPILSAYHDYQWVPSPVPAEPDNSFFVEARNNMLRQLMREFRVIQPPDGNAEPGKANEEETP